MLRGITAAVNAFKALIIVLAAAALMLLVLRSMLPQQTPADKNIKLNELLLNPVEVKWEDGFIELYNAGDTTVKVDGWFLHTKSGSKRLFGDIKPGEYRVLYGDVAVGESDVVLKDSAGRVVDTYSYTLRPSGVSVGRLPDGSGMWRGFTKPTPGAPNSAPEVTQPTLTTLPQVSAPECMRDEFTAINDNLGDIGYNGDINDFCTAFEEDMLNASPYVRDRIGEITDPEVRANIVYVVAERRVVRAREERIVNLVVSDSELMDGIGGLIGGEMFSMGLGGELASMNYKFKKMMFDILLNGTKTERRELKLQFKFYLESRESGGSRILRIDPDEVRVMLSEGDSLQEILVKLGV